MITLQLRGIKIEDLSTKTIPQRSKRMYFEVYSLAGRLERPILPPRGPKAVCAAAHASLCVYTDAPLTTADYIMSSSVRECGREQHGGWLAAAASHMRRNPAHCPQAHKFKSVFFSLSAIDTYLLLGTIKQNKYSKSKNKNIFKMNDHPYFFMAFLKFLPTWDNRLFKTMVQQQGVTRW